MQYLLLNSEKELSTQEILNHVWKNDPDTNSEVVWLYICYLKQKLVSIQSNVQILCEKDGNFKLTK